MVFLYLVFVIVVGLVGEGSAIVSALNNGLGTDITGLVWFFIGWAVSLILSFIFR